MDPDEKPIEGFVRRPKKNGRIDIIVISDDDDDEEISINIEEPSSNFSPSQSLELKQEMQERVEESLQEIHNTSNITNNSTPKKLVRKKCTNDNISTSKGQSSSHSNEVNSEAESTASEISESGLDKDSDQKTNLNGISGFLKGIVDKLVEEKLEKLEKFTFSHSRSRSKSGRKRHSESRYSESRGRRHRKRRSNSANANKSSAEKNISNNLTRAASHSKEPIAGKSNFRTSEITDETDSMDIPQLEPVASTSNFHSFSGTLIENSENELLTELSDFSMTECPSEENNIGKTANQSDFVEYTSLANTTDFPVMEEFKCNDSVDERVTDSFEADQAVQHRVGSRSLLNLQKPKKNTNSSLIFSTVQAKTCQICYDYFTNIVNHYKKKHIGVEIYVSRISSEMASLIVNRKFEAQFVMEAKIKYLKAKCFFCESLRKFTLNYWLDHIRIHTGEYAYHCDICSTDVSGHKHCGMATIAHESLQHNLFVDDLKGYLCTACNFVQLGKENMERHLEKQHEFESYEDRYQEVTLLPSIRSISYSPHIQHAESTAPSVLNETSNTVNDLRYERSSVRVLDDIQISPAIHGSESIQAGRKREQDWCEQLTKVYEFYSNKESQDHQLNVMPWIDNSNARKQKIQLTTQFAFYKCMHPRCHFSTNNEEDFVKYHLANHFELNDIGNAQYTVDDETKTMHKKCRVCPYCNVGPFKNTSPFIAHMQTAHGSSNFQCEHCFYRCYELAAIVLHYQQFHKAKSPSILVCNTQRKFTYEMLEQMRQNKIENLPISNQNHEFQCSYCNACNTNNVTMLRYHFANDHPEGLMYAISRRQINGKDHYVYLGETEHWRSYDFYKCGNESAINYMSPYLTDKDQNDLEPTTNLRYKTKYKPIALKPEKDVLEEISICNYSAYEWTQYHCSSFFSPEDRIAEYLESNSYYRSQTCEICSTFIKVNHANVNDEYVKHMEDHKTDGCYFHTTLEINMLTHILKKHKDKQFYKENIQRGNESLKKKRIEYDYKCDRCSTSMKEFRMIKKHFIEEHEGEICDVNIQKYAIPIGNDVEVTNHKNLSEEFTIREMFYCAQKRCKYINGYCKSDILQHHNEAHRGTRLEFRLKFSVVKLNQQLCVHKERTENEFRRFDRNFVYICGCGQQGFTENQEYCDVLDSVETMMNHYKSEHQDRKLRYTIQKLVTCKICNSINTHNDIAQHYRDKHRGQKTNATSTMTNPNVCGVCDSTIGANYAEHFKEHNTAVLFDDDILSKLIKFNKNNLIISVKSFIPKCCPQLEFYTISETVQHVNECQRKCSCSNCSTVSFTTKDAGYHTFAHDTELCLMQKFSVNFIELFNDTNIIFETGLVVKKTTIDNSTLGKEIHKHFQMEVNSILEREKENLIHTLS